MDIGEIRVGFPILQLEVRVHHSTPRSPTAFERILLELCSRFRNNTVYNAIPLERLFTDVLGVPDPTPILAPTVTDLVFLDVIRCGAAEGESERLAVKDIEPTERGHLMLSQGVLPGAATANDESIHYDPIRRKCLSKGELSAGRQQAPPIAIDDVAFREVFPEEAIRARIFAADYPWRSKHCHIERIERLSASVVWIEAAASMHLENGQLQLSFRSDELTNYVNSLPGGDVMRRIISPALGSNGVQIELLGELAALNADQVDGSELELQPVQQALDEFPSAANVWLVNTGTHAVLCPEEAGVRKAIICFDPNLDGAVEVHWNAARDGCVLHIRASYPLADAIIASDKFTIGIRRLKAKVGQDVVEMPVALRMQSADAVARVQEVLSGIEAEIQSDATGEALFAVALWREQGAFWRYVAESLCSHQSPILRQLEALHRIRNAYSKLFQSPDSEQWDRAVADVICCALKSEAGFDALEELECLVSAIEQCGMTAPGDLERVSGALIERLPPPKGLSELARWTAVMRGGSGRLPVPYSQVLYSNGVLSEIVQSIPGKSLARQLRNQNAFESGLRQLDDSVALLDKLVGGHGVRETLEPDTIDAVVHSSVSAQIREEAEKWLIAFDRFCESFPDIQPHLCGSELSKAYERIRELVVGMRKVSDGVDSRFRALFVIDTSAILERPQIMKCFRPDEFVIVSKRVIEELDDKKRDKSLLPKVREATHALRQFPKDQIQFCAADPSLLSVDYRSNAKRQLKGDNLILSVALQFRSRQPILVTNDSNLSLKARAENIRTMSVVEFDRRS